MTKNTKGFTLIELTIVIAILAIMALGISQMNFGAISAKQKSEIFSNKIKFNIETVKNNALIGKGIGVELIVPKKWRIDFSLGSTDIKTSYFSGAWIPIDEYTIKPDNNLYEIKSIQCFSLDGTPSEVNGTGTIIIEGDKLSLEGCSTTSNKIIEISSKYKQFENIFRLNTVSGVIKDIK